MSNSKGIRDKKRQKQQMFTMDASLKKQNNPITVKNYSLNVTDFAEARAFEIKSMENALKHQTEFYGNQRIFQRIPRYMRRRAASHNVKRLPTKLRIKALHQMSLDSPRKEVKKSSRRSKRRTAVIAEEFGLRQTNKIWLDTHIWHAKRFKMCEKWGFALPITPNDKSDRSLYKANKYQATLNDQSYKRIFVFKGMESNLIFYFQKVFDPLLSSIKSEKYISGKRFGSQILYNIESFPKHTICPVEFLWKQESDVNFKEIRTLWVFIHPAAFIEAVDVFSLLSKMALKDEKNFNFEILEPSEVSVFDISGPRSHAILSAVFKLAKKGYDDVYINDDAHNMWNNLKHLGSPSSLSEGVVLSLTIQDPRLSFPPKVPARKFEPIFTPSNLDSVLTNIWPTPEQGKCLAISSIFSKETLNKVESSKLNNAKLNALKGESLIPGSFSNQENVSTAIPILIIQIYDGWKIVIPNSFGRSLFHSLVFSGARVFGLADLRRLKYYESNLKPSFPEDWCGTKSYQNYQNSLTEEKKKKYYNLPPAKRGFSLEKWPTKSFGVDFNYILQDSTELDDDSMVVDPKNIFCINSPVLINIMNETFFFNKKNQNFKIELQALRNNSEYIKESFSVKIKHLNTAKQFNIFSFFESIMRVKIILEGEGTLKDDSLIYFLDSKFYNGYYLKQKLFNKLIDEKVIELDNFPSENLIVGFVGYGRFSYSKGKCTGLGGIGFKKYYKNFFEKENLKKDDADLNLVLVRSFGSRVARFGRIMFI
ncbi:Ribonucleases P/MRP protein subunit pop1 [Lobulomyces angularis]|nr:Ribonucleases P/MRP protein subunit pop1 [Lobulomyces angularis]